MNYYIKSFSVKKSIKENKLNRSVRPLTGKTCSFQPRSKPFAISAEKEIAEFKILENERPLDPNTTCRSVEANSEVIHCESCDQTFHCINQSQTKESQENHNFSRKNVRSVKYS